MEQTYGPLPGLRPVPVIIKLPVGAVLVLRKLVMRVGSKDTLCVTFGTRLKKGMLIQARGLNESDLVLSYVLPRDVRPVFHVTLEEANRVGFAAPTVSAAPVVPVVPIVAGQSPSASLSPSPSESPSPSPSPSLGLPETVDSAILAAWPGRTLFAVVVALDRLGVPYKTFNEDEGHAVVLAPGTIYVGYETKTSLAPIVTRVWQVPV